MSDCDAKLARPPSHPLERKKQQPRTTPLLTSGLVPSLSSAPMTMRVPAGGKTENAEVEWPVSVRTCRTTLSSDHVHPII